MGLPAPPLYLQPDPPPRAARLRGAPAHARRPDRRRFETSEHHAESVIAPPAERTSRKEPGNDGPPQDQPRHLGVRLDGHALRARRLPARAREPDHRRAREARRGGTRRPDRRLRVPLPERARAGEPRRGARRARRPRHLHHLRRPPPGSALRPRRPRLARPDDAGRGAQGDARGGGVRRLDRRPLRRLARHRGLQLPVPTPYAESWAWFIDAMGQAAEIVGKHDRKLFLEHKNSEPR